MGRERREASGSDGRSPGWSPVESPQGFDGFDTTSVGEPGGAGGFRLVTAIISVSPGLTCRLGDSKAFRSGHEAEHRAAVAAGGGEVVEREAQRSVLAELATNCHLPERTSRRCLGHECIVAAPSLTPKKPGDRVKTNRRDAVGLAKLSRAAVWIPDERHEAMRDLSRARLAAHKDLRGKRQQITSMMLRLGRHYPGKKTWGPAHMD